MTRHDRDRKPETGLPITPGHRDVPGARDVQEDTGPVSEKLRRVMDTRAGFWLRWGISVVAVVLLVLFLLAWSIPLDRFGGSSLIDYLLH